MRVLCLDGDAGVCGASGFWSWLCFESLGFTAERRNPGIKRVQPSWAALGTFRLSISESIISPPSVRGC